jgi:(2Fe-2S) ferredoxin
MSETDSFYRNHIFFCTNRRPPGHPRVCCGNQAAEPLRDYMKARIQQLGLERVRVNNAGCFDRCEQGPLLVIYPEAVWYACRTEADVEEIVQEHLVKGNRVDRLRLP